METFKQKVMRFLYPLIRKIAKGTKNGTILNNTTNTQPIVSFYDQKVNLNNGKVVECSSFSGKKVLLVNTASNCGYTGQYEELQKLHETLGDKLVIIAFPANDFAEQEKSADDKIAEFCQFNYGVTFPLAKKAVVIKNSNQEDIFKWLTDRNLNGWNDHAPDWNFSKYLIDEKGTLINYFGPSISPLEDVFLKAVNK